ncbi:MAG: 4Fe-4S dicluster domain-containing protein [Promethearchaeota archaeon]
MGCGAKIFELDTEKHKPVVVNPLKCKVGCVTYANTCPVNAVSFPPLTYIHKLIKQYKVIAFARNKIKTRN